MSRQSKRRQSKRRQSKQWIFPVGLLLSGLLTPAQAQITPDASLPVPSRVRRDGNISVITGGTRVGDNLFHSFRDFSIRRNQTASFRNIDTNISTIFSRVTGTSVSRINGILETLQSNGNLSDANFFLINPNGILFGRNASLNIGGSFVGTTAERVHFADGAEFSAANPAASLLTVSAPIGLQLGETSGMIHNQSRANLVRDQLGDPIAGGLQVATGRTLALIGNGLEVTNGLLTAAAGRIELSSVASGTVTLLPSGLGWQLDHTADTRFADIQLYDATVNVSGATGGAIHAAGSRFDLNGSLLISDTFSDQDGADISIRSGELRLYNFSLIETTTNGIGSGGNIRVIAERLTATAGGQISTRTNASGNAGNITVRSGSILLSGQDAFISTDFSPTGIFAQTSEASTGRGGRITIITPSLRMEQGASIATDTSGAGRAGDIQIQAEDVDLTGVLLTPDGVPLLDAGLPLPTGIFADSNASASGKGGAIVIETQHLRLHNGAVLQTNAEGIGDAGNLTIRATESVELAGRAGASLPPTTIFAASGGLPGVGGTSTATGRGGLLRIITPSLTVQNGAAIAVGSLNPNQQARGAGDLEIRSERVQLNRGQLLAATASGDGGDINLQAETTLLSDNSQISTSAGTEDRGGNGGNIEINTTFLFATPLGNNDILANAFTGNGGNITITAESILGLAERRAIPGNQTSDIDASSQFGAPGQVIIRSPDINPSTAAATLATNPLSDRPAQGCEGVQTNANAEFFSTGRGGIAVSPYEPLSAGEVLADLRLPHSQPVASLSSSESLADSNRSLTEAQGWQRNQQGEIMLVAQTNEMPRCRLR